MSEEEEQNDQEKKALMTLSIELGDKKKQLLNIFLDSKPEQLAYDFCLQNNLDFDSMQNLTEEIKNALANYKADSSNKENKNEINEEIVQKIEKEEKEEVAENIDSNIENNENMNEIEHKKEEVSEEYNQEEEKEEEHDEEQNVVKEDEQLKEEKEKKEEKEEKEEKHVEEEVNKEEKEKEKEKEKKEEENNNKELIENKEKEEVKENEDAEEELVKEEECDKVLEQNEEEKEKENNEENEEEEDEDIPSYLSPTICYQNKKRQKVEEKIKEEDFDTTYKKIDKISEFNKEINEKVINHLIINVNNQKYLPKDYYDNPENKNFGERLYNREKIMKEEAMDKARLKVQKENKKIEENITFTPKINDYNLIVLQKRKQNKMQYNEEKRILNYKDYLKAKEENTKNKHFADIEKENTFAPKINKNSEKMAGNRSLKIPKYEELYKKKLDVKKLENKIYDDKNMFKPKINKNYKGIKTENKKMNDYSNLTFEERQKKFKERMEQNKEKLNEIKNANIDQRTGKKYFKPTINKNSKLEIQRKNKKVFNELYRDSTKYKIKKEELVKKINELEKELYLKFNIL